MKITKATHKAVLYDLLFIKQRTMQGEKLVPISPRPEDLANIAAVGKKLAPKESEDKKKMYWENGDIEFTIDEASSLKKLFQEKKDWNWMQTELKKELEELFAK